MQKLAKRVVQAQNQVYRRAAREVKREERRLGREHQSRIAQAGTEIKRNIKDARRAQKDEWEMGPLAPKRDLGAFNNHGVIKQFVRLDWSLSDERTLKPAVLEKRCAWAGGSKQLNLVPGDRVVILEGIDKGKIDRIKAIQPSVGTVTLETYRQAMFVGFLSQAPTSNAMPIPIDAIRLVYPLTHPVTGVTRDVIINELIAIKPKMSSKNMTYERWEYGKKWDRLVPSLNTIIPWPETEAPNVATTPSDSVRDQVEERTFHYSLLSPPMPQEVLNELRNPYSKFRTRHEPWYVAKKEAEEKMKTARAETIRSMMTPLDELHEKRRRDKEARGEPELSEEMLVKLGEFIAKKKEVALSDAGISEISSAAADNPPTTSSETTAPPPQ